MHFTSSSLTSSRRAGRQGPLCSGISACRQDLLLRDESAGRQNTPASPDATLRMQATHWPHSLPLSSSLSIFLSLSSFGTSVRACARRLAKRQLTWFRGEPLFTWLDASQGAVSAAAQRSAARVCCWTTCWGAATTLWCERQTAGWRMAGGWWASGLIGFGLAMTGCTDASVQNCERVLANACECMQWNERERGCSACNGFAPYTSCRT